MMATLRPHSGFCCSLLLLQLQKHANLQVMSSAGYRIANVVLSPRTTVVIFCGALLHLILVLTGASLTDLARHRFFSSLVQRAAKVHRHRGGGSLTLLMVLPG